MLEKNQVLEYYEQEKENTTRELRDMRDRVTAME